MKKLIAVIALLSLCSCGTQTPEPTASAPQAVTEADTTITTTEEITTEADTTIAVTEDDAGEDPEPEESEDESLEEFISQFDYFCQSDFEEPKNLYEDDNVKVLHDWWVIADDVISVRLIVENKSNSDIVFKAENTSVNDYDIDIYTYEEISAGKKKIVYVENRPKELRACPFQSSEITNVDMRFSIRNADDYKSEYKTDMISVAIEQAESE